MRIVRAERDSVDTICSEKGRLKSRGYGKVKTKDG